MHGGGHTANIFMSTPDGREDWFTSLTRRGFAVYAVDGPNRGRSGWDPTARIQATLDPTQAPFMQGVKIIPRKALGRDSAGDQHQGPFTTTRSSRRTEAYIKQIQPAYRNLPAPAVQVE